MCVEFMLGKIGCSHNMDAATTYRIMKRVMDAGYGRNQPLKQLLHNLSMDEIDTIFVDVMYFFIVFIAF